MSTQTKEKPKTEHVAEPAENKGSLTVAQAKDQFREQLEGFAADIRVALPPDLSYDRYISTIMFSVSKNLDLLKADRRSLIDACIESARDQLLPDGREGALVIFKGRVQWMPMIRGLTKKVRATGLVKEFRHHVVYEGEKFEVFFGDREEIVHIPELDSSKRSANIVAAYAILETMDGGVEREVMIRKDLDKVRAVSRASNGPWKDWEEEMHRKSVARRLLKRVPLDPIVDQILSRDEKNFDLELPTEGRAAVSAPSAPSAPAPKRSEFLSETRSREADDAEVIPESTAETIAEIRKALEEAPTRAELAHVWHVAGTDGDLDRIAKADKDTHRTLCELYNSRAEAFEVDAQGEETAETETTGDAAEPQVDEKTRKALEAAERPRFTPDADGNVIDGTTGEVVPEKFVKRFDADGSFSVLKGYFAEQKEAAAKADAEPDPAAEDEASEAERLAEAYTRQAIAHLQTLATNNGVNVWFDNTFLEEAGARELSEEQRNRVHKARMARLDEIKKAKK